MKNRAAGFFHTERIDGIWWLVDPSGELFFSKGVNNMTHRGYYAPRLGVWPYRKCVENRYGSLADWAQTAVRRIIGWGFNTVGAWSEPSTYTQGAAFTVILDIYNTAVSVLRTQHVDLFSDAFSEVAERVTRERCLQYKDNKLLLGYFTDNELDWPPAWGGCEGMVERYWWFSNQAPGKQRLLDTFRDHFQTIDQFNALYKTRFGSFDEVFSLETVDALGDAVRKARFGARIASLLEDFIPEHQVLCARLWFGSVEEMNEKWGTSYLSFEQLLTTWQPDFQSRKWSELEEKFLREASNRYFKVCHHAVKRQDPNHMILGCRFFGIAPRGLVEGMQEYVDVISYNRYDFDPPVGQLDKLYREGGKPILLTEFSFKAMDSGLPNSVGGGRPLQTQQERAEHYAHFVETVSKLPYMVGFHWFEYCDQPKEGRFDGEDSNYGLVSIQDEPWTILTDKMREVNNRVEGWHSGKP